MTPVRPHGRGEQELRLAPDQLSALADMVAERLAAGATPTVDAQRLVSAQVVAEAIGMTAAWVREHGAELGGQRMGNGPRPRWRFDMEKALAAWRSRSTPRDPAQAIRRRRQAPTAGGTQLLPIRGHEEVGRAA